MQISSELGAILLALATAVITVSAKWLLSKISKLNSRIQLPIVDEMIKQLNEKYIPQAISFANQTFVDKLKSTGEWDESKANFKDNSATALNIAYSALLSVIPKFFFKSLNSYFTDMEATLKTYIETYIDSHKDSQDSQLQLS